VSENREGQSVQDTCLFSNVSKTHVYRNANSVRSCTYGLILRSYSVLRYSDWLKCDILYLDIWDKLSIRLTLDMAESYVLYPIWFERIRFYRRV